MLSTGALFTAKLWENTTAELFAGFLGLLLKHVGKPLIVIVDNASVHTAKAIKPMLEQLKQKGLTLYFLPPYSPTAPSSTASRSSGERSSTSGWPSRPATPKPWRPTSTTSLPSLASITG
ncbi:MAG: transposase [Hydrogenophaga sp.]